MAQEQRLELLQELESTTEALLDARRTAIHTERNLIKENEQLETDNEFLIKSVEEQIEYCQDMQAKARRLEEDAVISKERVRELEANVAAYHARVRELEQDAEIYRARIKDLEGKVKGLEAEYKELQLTVEEYQVQAEAESFPLERLGTFSGSQEHEQDAEEDSDNESQSSRTLSARSATPQVPIPSPTWSLSRSPSLLSPTYQPTSLDYPPSEEDENETLSEFGAADMDRFWDDRSRISRSPVFGPRSPTYSQDTPLAAPSYLLSLSYEPESPSFYASQSPSYAPPSPSTWEPILPRSRSLEPPSPSYELQSFQSPAYVPQSPTFISRTPSLAPSSPFPNYEFDIVSVAEFSDLELLDEVEEVEQDENNSVTAENAGGVDEAQTHVSPSNREHINDDSRFWSNSGEEKVQGEDDSVAAASYVDETRVYSPGCKQLASEFLLDDDGISVQGTVGSVTDGETQMRTHIRSRSSSSQDTDIDSNIGAGTQSHLSTFNSLLAQAELLSSLGLHQLFPSSPSPPRSRPQSFILQNQNTADIGAAANLPAYDIFSRAPSPSHLPAFEECLSDDSCLAQVGSPRFGAVSYGAGNANAIAGCSNANRRSIHASFIPGRRIEATPLQPREFGGRINASFTPGGMIHPVSLQPGEFDRVVFPGRGLELSSIEDRYGFGGGYNGEETEVNTGANDDVDADVGRAEVKTKRVKMVAISELPGRGPRGDGRRKRRWDSVWDEDDADADDEKEDRDAGGESKGKGKGPELGRDAKRARRHVGLGRSW